MGEVRFLQCRFLRPWWSHCQKRIVKNDAITKISAGEDNFCGSNWVKFPSVPSWREKNLNKHGEFPHPELIIYFGPKCQGFRLRQVELKGQKFPLFLSRLLDDSLSSIQMAAPFFHAHTDRDNNAFSAFQFPILPSHPNDCCDRSDACCSKNSPLHRSCTSCGFCPRNC